MDIVGVDIGTMFIVSAKLKGGKAEIKSLRNMFLPVTDGMIESSEIANTDLDYIEVKDEDGETEDLYIISEDVYRFGNAFNVKVRRPMANGVISRDEIDAQDILTLMVEKLVGKTKDGYCVFSVPEQAIDIESPSPLYHEKVFGNIFSSLGYKSKAINEAMAIVYNECQKENFSGIGISFGAGLTNVVCSYKGVPIIKFAVNRGGDWIDNSAASSLGVIPNLVTSIKEKPTMHLNEPFKAKKGKNAKREKRVAEAIKFYYRDLIQYVLKIITNTFNQDDAGLGIQEPIPIVVSGGTSKPNGFLEVFQEVFKSLEDDFPYEITEIRHASDPLKAVATGCLVYAEWECKKLDKKVAKKEAPKKEAPKEVPKEEKNE